MGCGGTLDCGVCACEGGQPVVSECGPCGLGRIECSSDTEGECVVPDVLSGKVCDDVLFVEQGANGDGSASQPFGTLGDALSAAQSGAVVVVAKTSTPYPESIVLKDGVSISGAWARQSQWVYDKDIRAEFEVPAPASSDVVGIKGNGINTASIVENLKVKTANASPSFNNYGFLGSAIAGLLVRRLEVRTGTGGEGLDGADGADGADGGIGADALLWSASSCTGNGLTLYDGGVAGVNAACPAANGGDGGTGMIVYGAANYPASAGAVAAQGTAGGKTRISAPNRQADGSGSVGTAFSQGAQNGSRSLTFGEVFEGRWVATGDGANGDNGGVGAGGGGGGGAALNPTATGRAKSYGAAGGGGGAGGCGGIGGTGGRPGGGAFALFVSDSEFTIENSEFTASLGGRGGNGGRGGAGGAGGAGGRGLSILCGEGVFSGGAGGAGANGQGGGAGAGGAGGVSYGGYCHQARLTLDSVSFDSLGAGAGGAGGVGGESGNTGESFDQYRCE